MGSVRESRKDMGGRVPETGGSTGEGSVAKGWSESFRVIEMNTHTDGT